MTSDEIVADYPDLEADDIRAALEYAAEAVRERARMGERGRAYFEAHHASGPIISSYEAALVAAAAQR